MTTPGLNHADEERILMPRGSTRHVEAYEELELTKRPKPRLGRRESEPHSAEITYLYDVLTTNFPQDRTMWDLHHYFMVDEEELNLQFDLSYFRNFTLPYEISSYRAIKYGNRRPTLALNILSRSTYNKDIGMTVEKCRRVGIPLYIVFNPYLQQPFELRAPFLRVYYQESPDEPYKIAELREVCLKEYEKDKEGALDPTKIIDVRKDILPFAFGIMLLNKRYDGDLPRYRLILINRETMTPFKTKSELALERAEEERKRAEEERKRAETAELRATQLEEELKKLKAQLEKETR